MLYENISICLTIREFTDEARPLRVARKHGKTLVAIHPCSTKAEIHMATGRLLDDDEANALRVAFGMPPRYESDQVPMFIDGLCLLYVPPVLRLPGEGPLQGGTELLRRVAANDLDEELELLAREDPDLAGAVAAGMSKSQAG